MEPLYRDNIKVHFAGAECIDQTFAASRIAGVKYFLFTVFPFIAKNFDIKSASGFIKDKDKNIPKAIEEISEHVIMDSGLFTLMFGAMKGKPISRDFIERWQAALVDFVRATGFTGSCVEVDCQKVLGVEDAWELREKLRQALPDNRIINVFHMPDGPKGLDRLIEFSHYIAISVPELRIIKPKTYKEDTHKLACYIKNKKPSIDIHLLGCTEKVMLEQNRFCTSADSTSWKQINRFGHLAKGMGIRNENKEKILQVYGETTAKILEDSAWTVSEKMQLVTARFGLAAIYHRDKYIKCAGNQD